MVPTGVTALPLLSAAQAVARTPFAVERPRGRGNSDRPR